MYRSDDGARLTDETCKFRSFEVSNFCVVNDNMIIVNGKGNKHVRVDSLEAVVWMQSL